MSFGNGTHPYKPKSVWCRRRQLMRWTGLTEEEIAYLVSANMLKVRRFHKGGRLLYYVDSAQELVDSGWQ